MRAQKKNAISMVASGLAIAVCLASHSAQATTVNSLTFDSANRLGPNTCQVHFTTSTTGTINDGQNADNYLYGHVTSTGVRFNGLASFFNFVGSTNTNALSIGISGQNPGTYFVVIYEADSLNTQGAELARVPIPRASLAAAGGPCAGLVINAAPTANAGPDQALAGGGGLVNLSGSASDGDGDAVTAQWTQISGPAVSLSGATTLAPSFTAPVQINRAQTLTFRLAVSDGIAASPTTDDVSIAIPAGPNTLPTADAGPDATITAGAPRTLAGSGNDIDGDPLTFQWTQLSGPAVTIANATSAAASFTAPAATGAAQALTFQLVANDGFGNSAADVVVLTVPANAPPTTNAGNDRSVSAGTTVTLAGTASDPENDPLTYAWTQTAGPVVALSAATSLTPSFTAPAKTASAQTLTFSLTATDGTSSSIADSVDITVPANVGPTSNAGAPVTVPGGTQGSLNGSGSSDDDGDTLTYQWQQVSGPPVTLTGANTATPSFTAPPRQANAQTLTFSLVVSDGIATSAPATVVVTIPSNAAPTANAGLDVVAPGDSLVSLEGAGVDPEGDPLTYQWVQTSGPIVSLAGATGATPSLRTPVKTSTAQVLTFALTVNDGAANSPADEVVVTVPANIAPVASAGNDLTVQGSTAVLLDGSASLDADGDPLNYSWVQTAGPAVSLSNAQSARPGFTAPAATGAPQTLTFELTVDDRIAGSVPDTVTVTISANRAPVADAGVDQGPVNSGQTVSLNGSASSDPDGNPLTYRWTQVSGPAAVLSNPASANPTFVAPTVSGTQNLVFQLIVNDGTVDSVADTVTISVRAVGSVTVIQKVVGADGSFSYSSDITALAGAITTINGTGQRSATAVPAGSHSLSVADGRAAGYAVTSISCNDTDSVVNLASRSVTISLSPNENLVCTFTSTNTRDAALTAIANFLTARNAALLSTQPDLQRRLDRLNGTTAAPGSAAAFGMPLSGAARLPLSLSLSQSAAHITSSLGVARSAAGDDRGATPLDLWMDAAFTSINYAGRKGRFNIVYAGADYRAGDSILVGGLVQFDSYAPKQAKAAASAKGHGWLAGPYVTLRLAPELYADVRAAWGKSSNTVSPLGTYVDPFDTTRSLYSASLVGQFNLDGATQIRPEIAVRHLDERQKAYVDSLGINIPGQTIGQGDVAFRPRILHSIALGDNWTLRPFFAADGIYSYGLERQSVFSDHFRMKIESGADLLSTSNIRASLSAFRDGLGSQGYKSSGLHVTISFGF